ncbi:MAG: diacylglycerol kinase family protein [Pyrinomonadaceae bacterium]
MIHQGVRAKVILNAAAGTSTPDFGGQTVAERLAEIFAAGGVEADIRVAANGAELVSLAKRAPLEGYPVIVAGGGDGTINLVASQLVGSEIQLGVLPLGTLNHFAKDLGIPLDLEAAAQTIISGHAVQVDVGEVNGRVFINNSSLGLYPSIVRHRERQQQRLGRGKWYALFWAALTVLRRFSLLSLRLTAEGETLRRRTPMIFVGNNEYQMEGFQIGARSCLDQGQLSVYVAHRVGRARLLQLMIAALFGRNPGEAPDFDQLCAAELWVETRRKRLLVATDGEVNVMSAPLHYRVRPGELRVIVPRPEDDTIEGEN